MAVQALVILAIMLLFVAVYGVAAFVVVLDDPTIDPEARPMLLGAIIGALSCSALMMAVFTVPYLVTAWGLRARKPWSHLAGLILSGLSLSNFPFGLIAGIIGFVVLLDKDITTELKGSTDVEPKGSSV